MIEAVVRADVSDSPVMAVRKGDIWSFSATGRWTNGWVGCGPDGYRNFLADALAIEPRVPGAPWMRLMGKLQDEPDLAAFAIGAGCTHAFDRDGDLVVFANDSLGGYGDNRGEVTLKAVPGGIAPGSPDEAGVAGAWRILVDAFQRTAGIPVIAAFVLGVSLILVAMPQGRDLVRSVGEDPYRGLQIAFALGLLFLGVQAWSWSRIVVVSNYGVKRELWNPGWLLEWGPRILSFIPFLAAAVALSVNPAKNAKFVWALLALGVILLLLLTFRRRIVALLTGKEDTAPAVQGWWTVASLASAVGAMTVAVLWPSGIGVALGAPAIVFLGLGFIIPFTTIAEQLGTSLRVPVTAALLLWGVLIGAFFDNHQVGRRALIGETTGPTQRLTLEAAYDLWSRAQLGGEQAKKTMILIAVQGGASRAGYWAAVALSSLHSAAVDAKPPIDFDSHVFAISSVSGGSVGSVGYAAMLKAARDDTRPKPKDEPRFTNELLGFAGRDALGPAMTGMLYSDLLYRFLPLWVLPDRAETIERSWEEAWDLRGADPPDAGAIREPFLSLAPKDKEPWRPLLIVQGASESGGRRVLTSAMRFDCNQIDADDFLDGFGQDIAASTAILNGARFPWVSPAGTFSRRPCAAVKDAPSARDHILDGGYFDNAGAETLREIVRALRSLPGGASDKLKIVFVLIGYTDHDPAQPPPAPPTGWSAWLAERAMALATNDVFAPLLGLYNGMGAHETHLAREMKLTGQTTVIDPNPYLSRMGDQNSVDYVALVLCPGHVEYEGQTIDHYDPPMDWSLSGEAKRYIENAVLPASKACAAKANADGIEDVMQRIAQ